MPDIFGNFWGGGRSVKVRRKTGGVKRFGWYQNDDRALLDGRWYDVKEEIVRSESVGGTGCGIEKREGARSRQSAESRLQTEDENRETEFVRRMLSEGGEK